MPRNSKKKSKRQVVQAAQNKSWGMAALQGTKAFLNYMPEPRLPVKLATTSLNAGASVYPVKVNLDVPLVCQSVAITAGGAAAVISVGLRASIYNYGSRFSTLFKEWCVVGVTYEIRVNPGMTSPQGFAIATFDETDNSNPTATSLQKAHTEIGLVAATDEPKVHKVSWLARGYGDLNWQPSINDDLIGYLKIFASTGDTFTSSTTAGTLMVTGTFACAFRQYA